MIYLPINPHFSLFPSLPSFLSPWQSQPRIATLLTLLDHTSKSLIHIANTHWDDRGLVARHESGKLLRRIVPSTARKVEKELERGDGKKLEGVVLLMGDLSEYGVCLGVGERGRTTRFPFDLLD